MVDGEAAAPADARLPLGERWRWTDLGFAARWPDDATHVFLVADGRRNPVDQVEALKPYKGIALAVTVGLLAVSGAVWLWRRTAGMARLATEEPELYSLWRRLEAERKG